MRVGNSRPRVPAWRAWSPGPSRPRATPPPPPLVNGDPGHGLELGIRDLSAVPVLYRLKIKRSAVNLSFVWMNSASPGCGGFGSWKYPPKRRRFFHHPGLEAGGSSGDAKARTPRRGGAGGAPDKDPVPAPGGARRSALSGGLLSTADDLIVFAVGK
ncbi:PREDICTED: uncharacterized protein LOC105508647 [Colobus angolensis palliatus]|uniref:uncharacterized protein LOC105508647 n=1 Tax=Colobus angolensis palliatus TaxID=336983 RepID=UPI0005F4C5E2|nr:PREDICTED: uncharacterized protein LOC105508647 [Colobus angolensis palliatus]